MSRGFMGVELALLGLLSVLFVHTSRFNDLSVYVDAAVLFFVAASPRACAR